MKEQCAKQALSMIKEGMIVGLGGGSTVALLISQIAAHGVHIKAVTPSQDTMNICIENGIELLPLESVNHIDVAFDGCDEVDAACNALKSCGGIHTREKIVATMADEYVLLVDEAKFLSTLAFKFPVVLEVIRSGKQYIKKELEKLGASVTERKAAGKVGSLVSDDGNYLLEAHFDAVDDPKQLETTLKMIPGVVETSLFTRVVTKVIIAGTDGVKTIERK